MEWEMLGEVRRGHFKTSYIRSGYMMLDKTKLCNTGLGTGRRGFGM